MLTSVVRVEYSGFAREVRPLLWSGTTRAATVNAKLASLNIINARIKKVRP